MLSLVSSIVSVALAAFVINDLDCTNRATIAYDETAFACENAQDDFACMARYGIPAEYAFSGGITEDRPRGCYTNGSGGSPDHLILGAFKDMAVAVCAKHCGYCCLTPEYKCENARFPRITCNTVTNRMCRDPLWREVIAQDCPNRCGFCLLGGCIDSAPDCETQRSICVTRGLETFVSQNCQRTCDLCNSSTTQAGQAGGCNTSSLRDNHASCVSWVKNAFCSNSFYTTAQKKAYCAKSCNLC